MDTELVWEKDGIDWPHRQASRFVHTGGLRWHVQVMGQGPVLLLLHGTGAATHSWRDLAPLLAENFTVIAPDLPGHGFTTVLSSQSQSLPGMSMAIGELLQSMQLQPALIAGHSAGAAIAVRMCLDRIINPVAVMSLNGALLPPQGLARLIFSPAAKLMAVNPLLPRLFAWRATDRKAVQRLLDSTGSRLDQQGVELYTRLVSNTTHVRGVLAMMANWDLRSMERDIKRLKQPLMLVVGSHDGTVPPSEATRVQRLLPGARIITLPGLGHLAHEEQPRRITALAVQLFQSTALSEVG